MSLKVGALGVLKVLRDGVEKDEDVALGEREEEKVPRQGGGGTD